MTFAEKVNQRRTKQDQAKKRMKAAEKDKKALDAIKRELERHKASTTHLKRLIAAIKGIGAAQTDKTRAAFNKAVRDAEKHTLEIR